MKRLLLLVVLLPSLVLAADPPIGEWAGLVVGDAKSASHYVHVSLAGDHGSADYDRGTCRSTLAFQRSKDSALFYEESIAANPSGRQNFQSGPFQPIPCVAGAIGLTLDDHVLHYEAIKDGAAFRGELFNTECAGSIGPCIKPGGGFTLMSIVGSQVVDDIEKPVYTDTIVRKVFLASVKDRDSGVWSDALYVTITHPGEFYYLTQGMDDLGRAVDARPTRRMIIHPMNQATNCAAVPRQVHCGHSEEDYILPLASGATSVRFIVAGTQEPLEFRVSAEQAAAHARSVTELSAPAPRPPISMRTAIVHNPPFSLGVTVSEAEKGPVDHGLAVSAVAPDSLASQAGLQPGDMIALFNGVPLKSEADLREAEKQTHPGLSVFLKVWRPGAKEWKDLRIEAR